MTLDELIASLEELREQHGGESAVELMTQQSYPFRNSICGLTTSLDLAQAAADDDGEDLSDEEMGQLVTVYLVDGGQLDYGQRRAWDIAA